jgi:hypothetical protein
MLPLPAFSLVPLACAAALTEVLLPKQVVICTPHACLQHLQQLKPVQFVAAFCSPADQRAAAQLWEQLGRAGPPLFLKVRAREALQLLEQVREACVFWGVRGTRGVGGDRGNPANQQVGCPISKQLGGAGPPMRQEVRAREALQLLEQVRVGGGQGGGGERHRAEEGGRGNTSRCLIMRGLQPDRSGGGWLCGSSWACWSVVVSEKARVHCSTFA